ncbi:MAG TPA: HigA family addiction module antitoxin [Roseiarcus sp.]|nr:HigA family addiction module antitoxin [Roseiarcus sp.]
MMKDPPHPGELIGHILEELHVTRSRAAEALGISRQMLHDIIAGKSAVTASTALRLEKALGSTADAWLGMQANFDLAKARKRKINVVRLVAA